MARENPAKNAPTVPHPCSNLEPEPPNVMSWMGLPTGPTPERPTMIPGRSRDSCSWPSCNFYRACSVHAPVVCSLPRQVLGSQAPKLRFVSMHSLVHAFHLQVPQGNGVQGLQDGPTVEVPSYPGPASCPMATEAPGTGDSGPGVLEHGPEAYRTPWPFCAEATGTKWTPEDRIPHGNGTWKGFRDDCGRGPGRRFSLVLCPGSSWEKDPM